MKTKEASSPQTFSVEKLMAEPDSSPVSIDFQKLLAAYLLNVSEIAEPIKDPQETFASALVAEPEQQDPAVNPQQKFAILALLGEQSGS